MSGYKILIADESEAILSAVQYIVEKHNLDYEVSCAKDGRSVCKIASNLKPDLILMDHVLPLLSGIRAICILKRLPNTRNIPVILITAQKSLHEAFIIGADDFIYKPFNEFELLFRIRFALTLSENMRKIKLQNELLTNQSNEMKRQYNLVEEQRKDFIDDITYSRRIQNATMPSKEYLASLFNQYFLFF